MTTGLQCSPSARSAALTLDRAACWAAAGLSEIDACRAASLAAASTEPCATEVRPAAMTSPIRARMTGARMSSSSAALPSSAAGATAQALQLSHGGDPSLVARSAACVRRLVSRQLPAPGQLLAPRPPGSTPDAVNRSTGAVTTSLTLITTPGTSVGTCPVTVILTVTAELPAGRG